MSLRLIATEEAFAPQEYLDAYIDATRDTDTAVARYLRMYYQKPDFARQLTDFDERLTVMDRNGVAMQVLSLTSPGVQAFGAAQGTELAALANDQLANVVRRHPTRFAGLAAVAPQSPEHAAQEIARAMSRLQLNGIIINSHTHGEFLDDPKFWPMLEAAVAHDAPIYLHPAFPPDAMLAPYSKHGMMGALWGFQAECSLHAVRMILGGVFDQFPTLRVVLGHLGEGIPYWLTRLDNRYQNILRRGGLEPLGMTRLARLPSEYFRSNFSVTTAGMNAAAPWQFCLDVLGPEQVMFAIDYPFEQSEEATSFIRSLQLPADQLGLLCHGNAERIFKIAI